MIDREKVIKAIECCVVNHTRCFDDNNKLCPYFSTKVYMCEIELLKDALELLKEQEDYGTELTNAVELILKKNERIKKLLQEQKAIEPKHYEATRYNGELFACGDCKHELEKKPRFCPYCGKEVKWDD